MINKYPIQKVSKVSKSNFVLILKFCIHFDIVQIFTNILIRLFGKQLSYKSLNYLKVNVTAHQLETC